MQIDVVDESPEARDRAKRKHFVQQNLAHKGGARRLEASLRDRLVKRGRG